MLGLAFLLVLTIALSLDKVHASNNRGPLSPCLKALLAQRRSGTRVPFAPCFVNWRGPLLGVSSPEPTICRSKFPVTGLPRGCQISRVELDLQDHIGWLESSIYLVMAGVNFKNDKMTSPLLALFVCRAQNQLVVTAESNGQPLILDPKRIFINPRTAQAREMEGSI